MFLIFSSPWRRFSRVFSKNCFFNISSRSRDKFQPPLLIWSETVAITISLLELITCGPGIWDHIAQMLKKIHGYY